MKLAGIKTEYTPKGKLKSIIINANAKSELVEDLIDTVIYEAHKNDEIFAWEDVKREIESKHKFKK